MVDIVMTTWNRPSMTERSIKAIHNNTNTSYRLIVVDNASNEGMTDMLQHLWHDEFIDKLILLPANQGLEPAKNVGLEEVKSPVFISTDNDIIPEKPTDEGDWLAKLQALLYRNPDYAAIACRPQVMVGTGDIFEDGGELVEFSHPGGSLRIMRTDLVKRVGGWRDEVSSRGQEEMYICGKLRDQGFKTGFATNIKCFHMFGKDGNWGYGDMAPEDHGHRPVSHPAIQQGDDEKEVKKYEA